MNERGAEGRVGRGSSKNERGTGETAFNERWICLFYNWSDVASANCRDPSPMSKPGKSMRGRAKATSWQLLEWLGTRNLPGSSSIPPFLNRFFFLFFFLSIFFPRFCVYPAARFKRMWQNISFAIPLFLRAALYHGNQWCTVTTIRKNEF